LALLLAPSRMTALALAACAAARIALDVAAGRVMREAPFAAWALPLIPFKDLLVAGAWLYGLTNRQIEWRSNRLTVLRGSVLRVDSQAIVPKPQESGTGHASATA
jgi:hypothetical protein